MRITGAESTMLFGGTAARPLQIMRVTVAAGPDDTGPAGTSGAGTGPVMVRVEGPRITTPQPFRIDDLPPGTEQAVEVAVAVAAPHLPGAELPVTAIAESPQERAEREAEITVAEPGWTVWMVSHFHYDPVWWNTQGQFTQTRLLLPGEDGQLPEVRTAFELVRLHLGAARSDPDYKFVLAEIDYLKPYFDTHPEDRADLRALIAEGRVEIVGGNYNEPNTNLTGAESTIRNAVYGVGYQRDVLGGDPRSAWMLDAFGFDPGYPGLMAAAGLTSSAWARGPYHQWGPRRTVGDNTRMQFPSEFEWMSPDGQGLLTSYMPNHYGAGWVLHQAADPAAAREEVLAQLASLAPAATTRNVLLPVGADHVIPARWATAVHREFRDRYVWPRCVTALPREFFSAVRAEAAERGIWLTPQTRDMNPVYPGKDVSYIDTKQAQRAAEVAVSDGERLATLAWLAGAEYPAASLDKAWRQLVFGAHHDAITGTESDQVYLDLLGGWREAFARGDDARREAAAYLVGLAGTAPLPGLAGTAPLPGHSPGEAGDRDGRIRPVVVVNTLSWPRVDLARITLTFGEPGAPWLTVRDDTGALVPFLAEGVRRHPGGSLAEITITFRGEMPALGYRTFWVAPAPSPPPGTEPGWAPLAGSAVGNETFAVEADPAHGGTLTHLRHRPTGADLLRGPGNELVLQEEYDYHPRWGEGQWLLSPKGPGTGSSGSPATVSAQRCPIGSRLVAAFELGGLRITQETVLWDGVDRVEFRTHTDGSIGKDRLLRVRFPADVPGALPIYQTATAVVGRPFGVADLDVAQHAFTLDNPAHEWFGLGAAARVVAAGQAHAIGVAEIILPGRDGTPLPARLRQPVRDLVAALAACGVTATCSSPAGPRYGALDLDSNLPDVRIALGGPEDNSWTERLLAALGPAAAGDLANCLASAGGEAGARCWVPTARTRGEAFGPSADVRGERDLPVLVAGGPDLVASICALTRDLDDAVVSADLAGPGGDLSAHPHPGGHDPGGQRGDPALAGHSVALLNRGTPSALVTPDGTLHIALMRASSAWPAGVWIDGEKRTPPDGSSFAWQHWSHRFDYALVAGAGDWRQAGFNLAGGEYNHELLAIETDVHDGPLPGRASLAEVASPPARPSALLATLKPRGNPLASGWPGQPRLQDGVTARIRDAGTGARPGPARLRLFTGISAGHLTGLLEDTDGAALPAVDGEVVAQVPAAGALTLAVTIPSAGVPVAAGMPAPGPPGDGPHPSPEPAQPVFTRYWLHGKGPAPAGNLPVAVHLSPGRVALGPAMPSSTAPGPGAPGSTAPGPPASPRGAPTHGRPDAGTLRVTVACGPVPARGEVLLDVPPALTVERTDGGADGLRYDLAGGGYAYWDLSVRAEPGVTAGRYFVAARIRDELGQVLEDAALVSVGEDLPVLDAPLEELLPVLDADQRATAAEVEVSLAPPSLTLAPGQEAELTVRIDNQVAAPVRGECQLISPWGTWPLLGPWTRGFSIAPGEGVSLAYPVRFPSGLRPGSAWWVLAKVMYFGRARYSESVRLTVRG